MVKYKAAVIISSDTCHIDPSKDSSGPFIQSQLEKLSYIEFNSKVIVPDEKDCIIKVVKQFVDYGVQLIITSGGTGLCPRDQTPDATESLYDRSCLGIAIALMNKGLQHSPHAALSRLTVGIIGQTLVVNFPGKLKACQECFETLETILQHALEQIIFDRDAIAKTHDEQDNFVANRVNNGNVLSTEKRPQPASFTNHITRADNSIGSSYTLVEYEDALTILSCKSSSSLYNCSEISLHSDEDLISAMGASLARDLESKTTVPQCPVSMMDGYVLNVSDWMSNKIKSFKTINAQLIDSLEKFEDFQDTGIHRNSFFCYQVNTGGKLPKQNFAIIPFENSGLRLTNGTIPIYKVELGKYIRNEASDMGQGYTLEKGTILGPIELNILISMRETSFFCLTSPLIGIISTGDEISNAFDKSQDRASQENVIDLNNPLLKCLFKQNNLETINLGIVPDDPNELETGIREGLNKCDILIITGGASMGTRDYVKSIIEKRLNGTVQFGRVNIKPGKPAAYATIDGYRANHIFSLPGNPVSAYMTSLVLVLPFVRYCRMKYFEGNDTSLHGSTRYDILGSQIVVEIGQLLDLSDGDQAYEFDGRLEFVRAKLQQQKGLTTSDWKFININNQQLLVSVSAKQQSSRLLSLRDCDCLILVEPNMKGFKFQVGQKYKAILLKA